MFSPGLQQFGLEPIHLLIDELFHRRHILPRRGRLLSDVLPHVLELGFDLLRELTAIHAFDLRVSWCEPPHGIYRPKTQARPGKSAAPRSSLIASLRRETSHLPCEVPRRMIRHHIGIGPV